MNTPLYFKKNDSNCTRPKNTVSLTNIELLAAKSCNKDNCDAGIITNSFEIICVVSEFTT